MDNTPKDEHTGEECLRRLLFDEPTETSDFHVRFEDGNTLYFKILYGGKLVKVVAPRWGRRGYCWDWYNAPKGKVTIPSTIAGFTVIAIDSYAFIRCTHMQEIFIPDTVRHIGYCPFFLCSSLASIVVDKDNPHYDCGEDCKYLLDRRTNQLIRGCGGAIIPDTVSEIIDFSECLDLESIVIPPSVTSIGRRVFEFCGNLRSVVIPSSVMGIGYSAFSGCCSLQSVDIPPSVINIGSRAFSGCSSLQSVVIPSSVTNIGSGAFSGCSSLQSIIIPPSVKKIEERTFSECINLQSIDIPSSVTSIMQEAFSGCSSLKTIFIPRTVTKIEMAFGGCVNLTSIIVAEDNPNYDSRENCNGIIETATNRILQGCHNTVIPNTVEVIGDSAFQGCRNLESITFPESVVEIGELAFADCTGLKTVVIPDTVKKVGARAFSDCSGLEFVTIPSQFTDMWWYVFVGCTNLDSLELKE